MLFLIQSSHHACNYISRVVYVFCIRTAYVSGSPRTNPLTFETLPLQEAYVMLNPRRIPHEPYNCRDINGQYRAYDAVRKQIFFHQNRVYRCVLF